MYSCFGRHGGLCTGYTSRCTSCSTCTQRLLQARMLLYTLPPPCRDLLEDLPFLVLLHGIPEGARQRTFYSSGCCMASWDGAGYRTSHSSGCCVGSRGVPESLMPSSDRTSDMLRAGQLGSASSLSVTQTRGAPLDASSSCLSFWQSSWKSSAQAGGAQLSGCHQLCRDLMSPINSFDQSRFHSALFVPWADLCAGSTPTSSVP